ncbi:MAG TPA: M20/M25/M40 family metallo-hydrolase [Candidatus Tumulicola sp.]|nr:M20/M25/M40 family metallo-hydrolase [Candidatus Tumulicola sp.]
MRTGRLPWFATLALLAAGAGLLAGASPTPGAAMAAIVPDPRIAALVAQVDPARLKRTDDTLVGFGTRNDFSERDSTSAHGVFGARDWIAAQFRAIAAGTGGRMTVRLDTYVQPKTPRTPRAVTESSVIATLQGDEPGRIYVMSSHYDDCHGHCTIGTGVAPGADDNGSGVSAVLEAARVMAATHFRGTIVFACFDGEELGLWGSNHYAREMAARHAPILAVLNNDIVGNSVGGDGQSEPGIIRVFSQALPAGASLERVDLIGSENDSPSRELSRFVSEVVPAYVANFRVRQIFRADRFLRGGDQESFQDAGFSAAIRFVEAHENFAHQHQDVRVENGVQYGDLPRYIDPAYLARATAANVAALATLALGPAPPGDVQLVAKKLGYDSTLRWKPAADAASYEIVWRASDAPQWQYAAGVGNASEATVPVSKDDAVLGVRSVDAAGLRSPAVYPMPVRE